MSLTRKNKKFRRKTNRKRNSRKSKITRRKSISKRNRRKSKLFRKRGGIFGFGLTREEKNAKNEGKKYIEQILDNNVDWRDVESLYYDLADVMSRNVQDFSTMTGREQVKSIRKVFGKSGTEVVDKVAVVLQREDGDHALLPGEGLGYGINREKW